MPVLQMVALNNQTHIYYDSGLELGLIDWGFENGWMYWSFGWIGINIM
jgi:hypothetical protein